MRQTTVNSNQNKQRNLEDRIWTIPNLLSFFRIGLIPVIVYLYCFVHDNKLATFVIVLSGITDIIDGFIARTFNMTSNLGKVLDPFADKLTQATILVCLSTKYPYMIVLFIIGLIKEMTALYSGYQVIQKTGIVLGAEWHGKISTCLLYTTVILHVFWNDIPSMVSYGLSFGCAALMILSSILYGIRNIQFIQKHALN